SFEYILIDCPPSLGLLTVNALTAADSVIIPIQCEYYALEGLSQLLNTIRLVQKHLNSKLQIEGVLLTMFDARTNLGIQVVEDVKKYFREKVYKTIIPRNVRLSEAPSHGMPVIQYDPKSRGAEVYMDLAREVVAHGQS
ncbi:MAG: ParA family protein, partial [Alicyclobacillaceae bacterium]|nr:ParA family protein [Alicyclobacillaceae bacterium]